MAIPDRFIDDLKERVDIVDVVDQRVKLKKSGRNYTACCPFHDENSASFSVSPDKQMFYCFGCGAGGDVISFLMDYDRSPFYEAVEYLAGIAGVDVPKDKPEKEKTPEQKAMPDAAVFAGRMFHQHLRNPEGLAFKRYFIGRGVTPAVAQRYALGSVGGGNLLAGNAPVELLPALEAAGLVKRDDNDRLRDFFFNRVMFPVRNHRGHVVGFGGRVTGDRKPKYLNSSESDLFQKDRVLYGLYEALQVNRDLNSLVVVEGYMDVVALACHGVDNAVASMGTAFGPLVAKLAYRYVDELVFCFDGDQAGITAAKRAFESVAPFMAVGKRARFVFLPDKADPDSFCRDISEHYREAVLAAGYAGLVPGGDGLIRNYAGVRFRQYLKAGVSYSDYFIQMVADGVELELTSVEGKLQLSNRARELLALMPDGPFKTELTRSVTSTYKLAASSVKEPKSSKKSAASAQAVHGGITLSVEMRDLLIWGDSGPKAIVANAQAILEHDDRWAGVLAYDEFSSQILKRRKPPFDDGSEGAWSDVDEIRLQIWFQREYGLDFNSSRPAADAARASAWKHKFHAVRDWLEFLQPWDGVERLPNLLSDYFGAEQDEYTEHVGQGLMVSAVARVMDPGCKVDTMVVLEGGQGQGKSSAIEELFTPDWYLESSESPGHKDFLINLQGNWGVEIGEMQSFTKADRNLVKQLITRRQDKFRSPYDKYSTPHPRQCIFVGTVNGDAYLTDPTGARRFLPVACNKADVRRLVADREQLWAEALDKYLNGFKWWEFPAELARQYQDSRFVEDVFQQWIEQFLRGAAGDSAYRDHFKEGDINVISTADLIKYACPPDTKQSRLEQMRVCDVMERIGWTKTKNPVAYRGGSKTRVWQKPDDWDEAFKKLEKVG